MSFDLEKALENGGKCKTVGGKPARVVYVDSSHPEFPLVVVVGEKDESRPLMYSRGGETYVDGSTNYTLQNLPEKREAWVHLYADGYAMAHLTKASSERSLCALGNSPRLVECRRIEWEVP